MRVPAVLLVAASAAAAPPPPDGCPCGDQCGPCPTPAPTSAPTCPPCVCTPAPTPAPTPTPTLPPKCSVDLDVLFVLDASKSIKQDSWQVDLTAAQQIASAFSFGCTDDPKVGGAEAKMGIIEYATQTSVEQPLTCDKTQFLSTLQGLQQPCPSGDSSCHGWTYTGDALEQAQTVLSTSGRANGVKLAIVITDGVPCTPDSPMSGANTCRSIIADPVPDQAQAAKARQWATTMKGDGVTIVTIAVGDFGTYGTQFIDDISSTPSSKYVFNPSTWKDLPSLIQSILDSICPPSVTVARVPPPPDGCPCGDACGPCATPAPTPAPTPVPTPVPTPAPTPVPTLPPKCSVDLDVLFVLDASKSIKQDSWQVDLTAAQQIASAFTFSCTDDPKIGGAAAEMGIIEFATQTSVEQPLTCDKTKFLSTLQGLQQPCVSGDSSCHGWTYTGDALEQAQTVFNSTGRPSDVKLAIVITDGVPCTPDSPMSGANTCRSIIADPVPDQAQAGKARQWATTLKGQGVTIVTIAVGDFGTYGTQFIDDISSTPSSKYVFNPSTWKDLPSLIQSILDSICPPQA